MNLKQQIAIVGGGLAGTEAAWQLGKLGYKVDLYEMRPKVNTPAHQTDKLAELVCSNSFKSEDVTNAHGLLKKEMEMAGSIIIEAARFAAVPAGSALAVDRDIFSDYITKKLESLENIKIICEEVTSIQSLKQKYTKVILASGPLTSDSLAKSLQKEVGEESLFFYDSIAPVVEFDSINMDIAFKAARYGKGEADYINCPMNKEEYENFIDDLLTAKTVPFHNFEEGKFYEGCLPIEVMAERGRETLSYGPMKPVGFTDPRTDERPWAILQLRQENREGTLYNLVGCQTKMTWPEQKRIFTKIPGLENVEFARLGSMHRNTYVNAPKHLNANLELKEAPGVYLAGQISGVEGYAESTAMGIWAAFSIVAEFEKHEMLSVDNRCMMGAMVNYLLTASTENFQPMNANFGLVKAAEKKGKKKIKKAEKREIQAKVAIDFWEKELEKFKS